MTVRLTAEYRRGAAVLPPGGLVDLPADDAVRLIEQGLAVPVTGDTAVERR